MLKGDIIYIALLVKSTGDIFNTIRWVKYSTLPKIVPITSNYLLYRSTTTTPTQQINESGELLNITSELYDSSIIIDTNIIYGIKLLKLQLNYSGSESIDIKIFGSLNKNKWIFLHNISTSSSNIEITNIKSLKKFKYFKINIDTNIINNISNIKIFTHTELSNDLPDILDYNTINEKYKTINIVDDTIKLEILELQNIENFDITDINLENKTGNIDNIIKQDNKLTIDYKNTRLNMYDNNIYKNNEFELSLNNKVKDEFILEKNFSVLFLYKPYDESEKKI